LNASLHAPSWDGQFVLVPTELAAHTGNSLGFCLWCRIGLVFIVSDEDDIDGMRDAGVALVRAYNYISDTLTQYWQEI